MYSPIAIFMRQLSAVIIIILCLASCRDKIICPAFQSTYILDDSVRMAYYSYLWKIDKDERLKYLASQKPVSLDSAGAVVASVGKGIDYFAYVEPYVVTPDEVKKTKFGIVKYEPYWLKNYELRTAPKENILAPEPIEEPPVVEDVGEFIASDFSDSAAVVIDSTATIVSSEEDTLDIPTLAIVEPAKPKTELKYLYRYDPNDKALNVEQAYYNKHFGQYLYTRVPIQEEVSEPLPDNPADSVSFGGFFKGLFKGKKVKSDPIIQEVEVEPSLDDAIKEDPNSGF